MQHLVFNKRLQKNFFIITLDNPLFCLECKKVIEVGEIVFIEKNWSPRYFLKKHYCEKCVNKKKSEPSIKGIITEFFCAEVTFDILPDSVLVFDHPPGLKDSRVDTVWSVADRDDEAVIIDHTKLAGREQVQCLDQDKAVMKRLEILERPVEDIDGFLEKEKKARKVEQE